MMNPRRRTFTLTVLLALAFSVLLSGCSYSQTGIESLLTPPKLSDQQNEIYTALESTVGKNVKLKYPRQGDFTSAFLINNIDNEPTQEAIVFYESVSNASAAMPIRINVFDQQDGKWVSKYEMGVEASEVDKVSFISSNQQLYIIIGFTLLSKSEKMVAVYTYQDGILNQTASFNCMDYDVSDIDGDKTSEIISFVQNKSEREVKTTTAVLQRVVTSGTRVIGQAPMDPNVTSYVSIQKGKLDEETAAIYIDGLKGANIICTEILAMQDGMLKNMTYSTVEEESIIDSTNRNYGARSMDLDSDGVYEIPLITPSIGYEDLPPLQQQYLTGWYNLKEGKLELKKTTYVAYSLGYVFTLPPYWLDKVKIDFVAADGELCFYDYSLGDAYDAKIASIKVVKRNEYEKEASQKGYLLLKDNGQLLYTYKLYETSSLVKAWASTMTNGFQMLPNK